MPFVRFLAAESWPSTFDLWVLAGYVLVVIGVPVAGYVLLVVDIRKHYRRLKQALMVVSNYKVQLPSWVAHDARQRGRTPACLAAFGLELPCSEADLLEAYRELVKTKHPDLGGDRSEFLQLQRHFEEARSLLASLA